jgi:hypothetical protein
MARHILMEVRDAQQKFQHAVSLIRVWVIGACFEVVDHSESVREQVIHSLGIHGSAVVPTFERLICAYECLIQKMVEAQLLRDKTGRNWIGARSPSATGGNGGIHNLPWLSLRGGGSGLNVWERLT